VTQVQPVGLVLARTKFHKPKLMLLKAYRNWILAILLVRS
jgi:hypothetical protein